jgi:hypothetical protein
MDDTRSGYTQSTPSDKGLFTAPLISLPKGGRSIHSMGEKFAVKPVTGTDSMSVPIATNPGHSGFGPLLSISYDSGTDNGPFRFGLSLSVPSITRKTDKGLPKYQDTDESDVFILSCAEALVPVLKKDAQGNSVRDPKGYLVYDVTEHDGHTVKHDPYSTAFRFVSSVDSLLTQVHDDSGEIQRVGLWVSSPFQNFRQFSWPEPEAFI